jgi:hypothetical protein
MLLTLLSLLQNLQLICQAFFFLYNFIIAKYLIVLVIINANCNHANFY